MEEFGLIVSFADQSEPYVLGFEAGLIWAAIEAHSEVIDRGIDEGVAIHAANIETARRMAAARDYQLQVGVEADGWLPVRLVRSSRPAGPKLRIV